MTAERRALIDAWAEERAAAKSARSRGDLAAEWHHLERAHILSQPMAGPHVRTHVSMLGYGIAASRPSRDRRPGGAPHGRSSWYLDGPLPGRQHRWRRCQRAPADAHPRRPPSRSRRRNPRQGRMHDAPRTILRPKHLLRRSRPTPPASTSAVARRSSTSPTATRSSSASRRSSSRSATTGFG